ncbi:C-type lectin domain family 4 member F-like isoform X2 [Mauremys mutica]|uniref:C-type lectin domain family 4 member F-like isoform X2 n=1 Tax=Mauremys mutica TaxID=74926 RepID=UPI001D166904|nr:C-type lectin domain family 4 member F-like isoform X2 [Mauremys mutica]
MARHCRQSAVIRFPHASFPHPPVSPLHLPRATISYLQTSHYPSFPHPTARHHFPFLFLFQGCCQREALTQQAAERTHRPVIRGSAQREGRTMARGNIYENMPMTEAAPQPKDLQAQSKLQAVEEAVQKLQVSLQPDDASDASAKGSDSLQLLDEAQAGVQKLKSQLGNVSAAYGEIQIRLDNVSAARAAVQGRCSDVLTKLSRGWRFYGENLYYFSQERKSWDEAEQFCLSQDSHLTSVSSQAEQEFLSNETQGEAHWIGLTDRETEDSWRWADGTEYRADASRGFWEENQPDNWHQEIGGREDCVKTRAKKLNMWNDANCTLPSRWICKQAHG